MINIEKFYLEQANLSRKEAAIEYILEHQKYNSVPSGTSGLDDEYENYEKWLEKVKMMSNPETCLSDRCCGIQYYLIRENDDRIVGTINLRWNLNEWMLNYGGHIGYGIRPTERRKGYNKLNLYLCLLKAKELGLTKVLLTVDDNNDGSIKTIEAFEGKMENKVESYKEENTLIRRYWVDVNYAIEKYDDIYEPMIIKNVKFK